MLFFFLQISHFDWLVINSEINNYLSKLCIEHEFTWNAKHEQRGASILKKCNWATMILFTCMWSHSWKWSQYCSRYFRTSVWWTKEGRCFAKGKSGKDITSLGILVLVCEKNTWKNIIKPQYCFKDLKCITGYWYFKKSLKGGYYLKVTFKNKGWFTLHFNK